VAVPSYNPAQTETGIVHLGFGGFHRAHMALYTDKLMNKDFAANKQWGIAGVGLMPNDKKMQDALEPQDCLYTLVERDGKTETAAVVGCVSEIIFAGDTVSGLLSKIENPAVKIVSLTVTENGYCLNPTTKKLDPEHALVKNDVANPSQPKSAIGVIVESYRRRKNAGARAFTALSCDNIQHNGDVLREAVISLATLQDKELASWIEVNATFPNTMVDRITPVTKPEDIAYIEQEYGITDQWPVVCEAFTQWVIEDNFADGRPAWEEVGAQFVPDVAPYEVMKLRLLNCSHLAVACLGDLAGYKFIDETMANPLFQRFMQALMDKETGPTLPDVPGIDLPVYKRTLVERFVNPSIKDTVERVATDAPLNTALASIRDRLKADAEIDLLALTLAAWLRRSRGEDENGQAFTVRHPLAARLKDKAVEGGSNPAPLLSIEELFGELGQDPRVVEPTARYLASLYEKGSLATLQDVADTGKI
jgi:mannitol-1-phosphate/altronate dehydrogenase